MRSRKGEKVDRMRVYFKELSEALVRGDTRRALGHYCQLELSEKGSYNGGGKAQKENKLKGGESVNRFTGGGKLSFVVTWGAIKGWVKGYTRKGGKNGEEFACGVVLSCLEERQVRKKFFLRGLVIGEGKPQECNKGDLLLSGGAKERVGKAEGRKRTQLKGRDGLLSAIDVYRQNENGRGGTCSSSGGGPTGCL